MNADHVQPASQPQTDAEVATALRAWTAEQMARAVDALARLESTIGGLKRMDFKAREAAYNFAAAAIREGGAVQAIEAVQAGCARAGFTPEITEECVNLIHAQVAGMRLTEFVDAESATSWLQQHRRDAGRQVTE